MPKWDSDPNKTQKNFLIPLLFTVFSLFLIYLSLSVLIQNNNTTFLDVINLIASVAIFTYSSGRLYGEYTKDKDFIELKSHSISYRETPSFGSGWLPQNSEINFDMINTVDLIQISSLFNQDKKSNALLIYPKKGKNKIIGSHLSREDLFKIALGLKGTIKLSSTLQRLLGDNPELQESFKNIISKGKEIWNKFQEATKERSDFK